MGVTVRQKVRNGPWWVFLNHQGKRKSKCVGDKATAEAVARELRKKIAEGDFKLETKKPATFGEYAEKWINVTVPATCKPSTCTDYEGFLKNHILPVFATKTVTEINRSMVRDFLMQKINEGKSRSAIGYMKSCISGVLNLAVDDETIQVNPAHRLRKIVRTDKTNRIDPLTREELSRLLATFGEHFPGHYPLALILARTGMRIGEALALQWGDIDFHGRFITVQRAFSRGRLEIPKSAKVRKVDMSKQLTETLLALRHQRKVETMEKGWGIIPDWIFTSNGGTPLDPNNWKKRVFDKALEKAGLRKVRVHDLRHTYASLLIQAGESLTYVKEQLGHHSIKVTVDIYGHLAPEGNKDAVDRLDDLPFNTYYKSNIKKKLAKASMPNSE